LHTHAHTLPLYSAPPHPQDVQLGQAAVSLALFFPRNALTYRPPRCRLANVAGTQEPIYGPEAIQSVNSQETELGFTELTKNDLKWVAMESTCVETQTFYIMADSGHIAMAQIIYSNVA
jgi:hypothetical protein